MIPTEYVDVIDHNTVTSRKKKKVPLFDQFIAYRVKGANLHCVGYLMIRPDTPHELTLIAGNRWELSFCSRDGVWRRVIAKQVNRSETPYDPEVKEREQGEREALFGLGPWGDVAG